MANHCVENTCIICGGAFCSRGCKDCKCGNNLDDWINKRYCFYTNEKIKELKKEWKFNREG